MGDNAEMYIVYVTGGFASKDKEILGGMPNYIYKMAKYMKKQGHSVTILTPGVEQKEWSYDGIPVYNIAIPQFLYKENIYIRTLLFPAVRDILFNRALSVLNKREKISIVQYAGWFGVGMLYNRKFPSVIRLSIFSKVQLYARHSEKELKLMTVAEKMAAKRFDLIIAPSRAIGKPYGEAVKRKVHIIKTPYYKADVAKEADDFYKRKLNGKRYFLFFGRVSPDKGILTIGRTIKAVLQKQKGCLFCFAGPVEVSNGENMMRYLKKQAGEHADRVLYLGNLTHDKLFPVIRNAECIVMPSLMDNLPNGCLEAMELNGIVIGTRGASFDEIFKDGYSGLLINIDDEKALEKKIEQVMQMTSVEKQEMRKHAKERLDVYKPEKVGRKMETLYRRVISSRQEKKS